MNGKVKKNLHKFFNIFQTISNFFLQNYPQNAKMLHFNLCSQEKTITYSAQAITYLTLA